MQTKTMTSPLVLATLVTALSGLAACTTMRGMFKDNGDDAASTPIDGGNYGSVVQQVNHANPVISKLDRQSWIDVRNSSNNAQLKMYAALAAGDAHVAEVESRAYLHKHPKDLAGLNVLTASLLLAKKFETAAFYANMMETYYPGTAESLNARAIAVTMRPQNRLKDYQRAMALFQKAFNASSEQIASGLNLGHLYLELGNAGAASEIFDTVSVRCHECNEGLIGSGIALHRLGQFAKAEERFKQVLSKEPMHPEALYRMALVAKNGYNDNKSASKYLKVLLTDASQNDHMLIHRANTLYHQIDRENESGHGSSAIANKSKDHTSGSDTEDVKVMTSEMDSDD